eukprot:336927-Prymnesium_polylepis.1
MGIAGMGAVDEQPWGHGAAIAHVAGHLITISIGINDFWWCGQVEPLLKSTVAGIRAVQPLTPIVLITPTP